jgi:hypothetical protein
MDFKLTALYTHTCLSSTYNKFRLAQNSTCAGSYGTYLLRKSVSVRILQLFIDTFRSLTVPATMYLLTGFKLTTNSFTLYKFSLNEKPSGISFSSYNNKFVYLNLSTLPTFREKQNAFAFWLQAVDTEFIRDEDLLA